MQRIALYIRRMMPVADIVRVVDLDKQTAGLRCDLEQSILQVPVTRRVPAEVFPEMRHRSPRVRH